MNWDFIYRGEVKNLDDAMRRSVTNGSFIKLTDGFTHYELDGESSGQPVILIPGFSAPYFIWDSTFYSMVSAGFRVLRYDLFGRGFSDRPHLEYEINLFVRQLCNLLDGLQLKKVDLIGLSMGGAIASAFTVSSPQSVRRLVLIDPVGVLPMQMSLLYKAALLPGISELILSLVGTEKMIHGLASDFFDPLYVKLFQDQYSRQIQIKGFKRAILSTLRNKTVNGFPRIYEQLGRSEIPIMLLWGRDDQTLPLKQSESLLKLITPMEFHIIDDCGHVPHYERPELVNPTLINFLNPK
jgi:pimeloyl-ACP methyl ester carboxylesterase